MSKNLFLAVLSLILIQTVIAADSDVLYPLWNNTLKGDFIENVQIEYTNNLDINKDKYDEIIVVTSGSPGGGYTQVKNKIYVIQGNGLRYWYYGIDDVIHDAEVFDVDRDGTIELFVSTGQTFSGIQRGRLHLFDTNGVKIRSIRDSSIMNSISIKDLDGDQYYEIIGGSKLRAFVYGVGLERVWMYPQDGTKKEDLMPKPVEKTAVGQIDGYHGLEVILGSDKIYIIDETGVLESTIDVQPEKTTHAKGFKYLESGNYVSKNYDEILSITNDNKIKIIIVNSTDIKQMKEYEKYSMVTSRTYTPDCEITALEQKDYDQDDTTELFLGCSNRKIIMLDMLLPKWNYIVDGSVTDIKVNDIDADGADEVIILSNAGTIYALTTNGQFKWKYETDIEEPAKLMTGNIIADEKLEVIVLDKYTNLVAHAMNQSYIQRHEADSLYNIGQKEYLSGQYDLAEEHIRQALDIYETIGYEWGIINANKLLEEMSSTYVDERKKEAETYYTKATEYFISQEYDLSLSYAIKAQEIYIEFGDSEGLLKVELLELRIKNIRDNEVTGSTLPPLNITPTTLPKAQSTISNTMLVIGGILIIVILIIITRKRGEKKSEEISDIEGEWGEI